MEPRPLDDPLPVEMVCAATLSQRLHPDDLKQLERIITWRQEPEFPLFGRSAWLLLAHPFESRAGKDTQVVRSLKVKGVGLLDHRDGTHRPSNAAYRRPDGHLGITAGGGFCELRSAPAPLGGLALNRAIVEYTTAGELCAAGPISEVPLLLYRYLTLDGFRDDAGSVSDLAVLIAGLPTRTPARADSLVHYARQKPAVQAALRDWMRDQTGESGFDWLKAQLVLWREYGRRLREFHDCGFYRHNSHPCNLGLGPHGVFFVDLDSTRHLLECSPRRRALQTLRDAAGAVFHIIDDTIRSAELDSAGKARAVNATVIDALLSNYFPDVADHAFDAVQAEAGAITAELWAIWARAADGPGDPAEPAGREYRDFMAEWHSQRGRGVDGPAMLSRLMPGLAVAYSQSRAAYQGGAVSPEEVRDATDDFLRRRPQEAA